MAPDAGDERRERGARHWASTSPEETLALMREVTGLPIYGVTEKQLYAALVSGVLLVAYANKLFPHYRVEAHRAGSRNQILAADNIQRFAKVARAAGVPEGLIFTPEDVRSGRGLGRVHTCLEAMRSLATARGRPAGALTRQLRPSITTQGGLPPPPRDLVQEPALHWLTDRGGGCAIARVEERAISLRQLEELLNQVRLRCARGGLWWCLEEPASAGAAPRWEARALAQHEVNLDHFLHTIVRPATRARDCSLVELMATAPQPPRWVVSVAWAEPVETLVACLRAHAADRDCTPDTLWWVDVFASRRFDLAAPLPADPSNAPFCLAARRAAGALVVIDGAGTTFSRPGFGLELHAALTAPSDSFLLDVSSAFNPASNTHTDDASAGGAHAAASATAGGAEGGDAATNPCVERLSDGLLPAEDVWAKCVRESAFNEQLASHGLAFGLERSVALPARAREKEAILEHIGGGLGAQAVESSVRALFLLAKLPLIASQGTDAAARAAAEVALTQLRAAVLRRVLLTFVGDSPIDWVAAHVVPALPRTVHTLALTECNAPSLCAALSARQLPGCALTSLDLSCNDIGAEGAMELAALLRPGRGCGLLALELFGNPLGDEGVAALCEPLEEDPPLAFLGLQAVGMGDRGSCALAAAIAANKHLREIVLRGNEVEDGGAYYLAEGLKSNGTLRELDLFCNKIEERGAQMLASALHGGRSALTALNLDTNDIGDEGGVALAKALETNSCLRELELGSSHEKTGATAHLIGERGGQALGLALANNRSLAHLGIGGNAVRNKGAVAIADALRASGCTLSSLALGANLIDERGAIALSSALALPSAPLTALDLSSNAIGNAGAHAIAEALAANSVLLNLDVSGCEIGNAGAAAFAGALRANDSLLVLKLGSNDIGPAGGASLASALKVNSTLSMLGLGENSLGDEGGEALVVALEANTTLSRVTIWHNALSGDAKAQLRTAWAREGRLADNLLA